LDFSLRCSAICRFCKLVLCRVQRRPQLQIDDIRQHSTTLGDFRAHSGVARVAMTGSDMPESVPVAVFIGFFEVLATLGDSHPH